MRLHFKISLIKCKNCETNNREHNGRKKTEVVWLCDVDGPPVHTTANTVLRGSWIHRSDQGRTEEAQSR